MKVLIVLAVITGLLLWYALQGREWLKSKPWAEGFFAKIEPVEILLFKKSETIIAARTLQALGGILTAMTFIGSIDITPILPLVPEKYAATVQAVFSLMPLVLNLLGGAMERLRNRTSKPVELVTIPDKLVAENPVLADAMVTADVAKVVAVAEAKVAVAEAKAA